MASIIKEILVDAPAEDVWDAVADFGALHTRFCPGFVTGTQLVPGARLVTFDNGQVVREVFLGADATARRLAYAIESERLAHHSAAFQVLDAAGGGCRLVWTADVLPDEMAGYLAGRMEDGLAAAKDTVGRVGR